MTSARVRIAQLDADTLAALADGDLMRARASSPTPLTPLTPWLAGPESVGTWRYRAKQALETPDDLPWITGVLCDAGSGAAVGKAGFHAAPDSEGMIELGYAVDPAYRRRGYARAALELMIDRARREPTVHTLRATVSPTNEPSLALIGQYAFVEVGEQWDDEDGLEIIYEMPVG